jgi:hypothetical protein
MKNLLSENMLRFGTKNLTEANKRNILLEQKMYTGEPGGKYKLNPPSAENPYDANSSGGNHWKHNVRPEELGGPGWKHLMDDEEGFLAKSPTAIAWKKRNPTYEAWRSSANNGSGQQWVDSGLARATFELQLLRKDRDNNQKYKENTLANPDKNYYGYAQKIYSEIDKGLGGEMLGMADDEDKVVAAIRSISTIAGRDAGFQVYANLLKLVKTSAVLKAKYRSNYNLVSNFIAKNGIGVNTAKDASGGVATSDSKTRTNTFFGGPQANDPYMDIMKKVLGFYNPEEAKDHNWKE